MMTSDNNEQLRISRDRFDEVSKPGELRACVEGLASKSVLHPLQTRRNRATILKAREELFEARTFSASCRIGTIREHRAQGKLKDIASDVREVMLPARQSKTSKTQPDKDLGTQASRPRLLQKISPPWSSTSTFRAAQPPKVDLRAGVPKVPGREALKRRTTKKATACPTAGALAAHPTSASPIL